MGRRTSDKKKFGKKKFKRKTTVFKPKICKFCTNKDWVINYKEINYLRNFISERGRIIPRRISGNCAVHQRKLTSAIKRARAISLIPFVAE